MLRCVACSFSFSTTRHVVPNGMESLYFRNSFFQETGIRFIMYLESYHNLYFSTMLSYSSIRKLFLFPISYIQHGWRSCCPPNVAESHFSTNTVLERSCNLVTSERLWIFSALKKREPNFKERKTLVCLKNKF